MFASSSHHKRFKQPYGENGDNTKAFVALGNQCFGRMLELIELCRVLRREVVVEQPVRVSDTCTLPTQHSVMTCQVGSCMFKHSKMLKCVEHNNLVKHNLSLVIFGATSQKALQLP